jgi:GcrA cell cycle regulator
MQSNDWPPDHSKALCDLHAKGMSYGEIARVLNARFGTNYTRNATLGRGKRIGLVAPICARPQRPPLRRGAKPATRPKTRLEIRFKTPSDQIRPLDERDVPKPQPVVKPARPVKLRCVGISPRLIAFDQLEPGDCRYPYGGDRDGEPITFCGHPRRPGSSYCTPHFDLTRDPELAERQVGPVVLRLVGAVHRHSAAPGDDVGADAPTSRGQGEPAIHSHRSLRSQMHATTLPDHSRR